MVFKAGRLGSLLLVLFVGMPVAALDFEREINKQERTVKVKYKRAPKSMAHFLHQYAVCESQQGRGRTACNIGEAKRRYQAYRSTWDERQRRQAAMETGDFKISLERKSSEFQ